MDFIMDTISIKVKGIKHIESANIEIPFEGGLYGFVGSNGCGKSTIMLILSVLLSERRYLMLKKEDYNSDSFIEIGINTSTQNLVNLWQPKTSQLRLSPGVQPFRYNGIYEGSLFYGTRFDDSRAVDQLLKSGDISHHEIEDSVEYIKDNLSHILHGDKNHYRTLKKNKK